MSTTTKVVRQKWVDIAKLRIKMDSAMNGLNGPEVVDYLVKEFGISRGMGRAATEQAFIQTRAVFVKSE
jgi:hypothetical protein